MSRCSFTFALLLCLGFLAGCGEDVPTEEVPPLQPVSGTVTVDGEPVQGVAITFVPTTGTGNGAYGATDASGKYDLQYRTGEPGIPAGEYMALFTKVVQPDGSPIPEGQTAADVNAVDMIPDRYRQMDGADRRVTVPQGGTTFDYDIRTK